MVEKNFILPGNPRYQPKSLQEIFGYDNLYVPVGEVEVAGLEVLGEIGIIPKPDFMLLTPDLKERLIGDVLTTEVDKVERTVTKHDIRAWVRLAQEILPPPLRRWVHVPFTSYDPLDTARSLQFCRAHSEVVHNKVIVLLEVLRDLIERYASTLQIGRTHGQHALPITVGFWLATLANRVLWNAKKMDEYAEGLTGKISGAVGAYNAQVGLGIAERCIQRTFEERVLAKLGLKPASISTQILPPEPLAYYLFSVTLTSAALGQLGRDMRNLMRTEIAEIGEPVEAGQVYSSTMAHKRNPINFENVEGMWIRTKNEFGKVLDTLISEHQRDLVGSSVARDFPIILINFVQQLDTLLRRGKDKSGNETPPFLARLTVNPEACEKNFAMSRNVVLAEPLYIALQMAGYDGDGHKLVNEQVVPLAIRKGILLLDAASEIAENDPDVKKALEAIPQELQKLLRSPESYIGNADLKARAIVTIANNYVLAT